MLAWLSVPLLPLVFGHQVLLEGNWVLLVWLAVLLGIPATQPNLVCYLWVCWVARKQQLSVGPSVRARDIKAYIIPTLC